MMAVYRYGKADITGRFNQRCNLEACPRWVQDEVTLTIMTCDTRSNGCWTGNDRRYHDMLMRLLSRTRIRAHEHEHSQDGHFEKLLAESSFSVRVMADVSRDSCYIAVYLSLYRYTSLCSLCSVGEHAAHERRYDPIAHFQEYHATVSFVSSRT
jgi:hypothetical protein